MRKGVTDMVRKRALYTLLAIKKLKEIVLEKTKIKKIKKLIKEDIRYKI